jgi:hypothetical protein
MPLPTFVLFIDWMTVATGRYPNKQLAVYVCIAYFVDPQDI